MCVWGGGSRGPSRPGTSKLCLSATPTSHWENSWSSCKSPSLSKLTETSFDPKSDFAMTEVTIQQSVGSHGHSMSEHPPSPVRVGRMTVRSQNTSCHQRRSPVNTQVRFRCRRCRALYGLRGSRVGEASNPGPELFHYGGRRRLDSR